MADLIDRKATIDYFVTYLGWYDECDNPVYDPDEKRKYITEFINGITPVDAVPIVRCKNCKNRETCEIQWGYRR